MYTRSTSQLRRNIPDGKIGSPFLSRLLYEEVMNDEHFRLTSDKSTHHIPVEELWSDEGTEGNFAFHRAGGHFLFLESLHESLEIGDAYHQSYSCTHGKVVVYSRIWDGQSFRRSGRPPSQTKYHKKTKH